MSIKHWKDCYDVFREDPPYRLDSVSGSRELICKSYIKWLEEWKANTDNHSKYGVSYLHVVWYNKLYGTIKESIDKSVLPWPIPHFWDRSLILPISVSRHDLLIMSTYISYLVMEIKFPEDEDDGSSPDEFPELVIY